MITYNDKVDINTNSNLPDENKVTASDMNQIKKNINDLYTKSKISLYKSQSQSFTTNSSKLIFDIVEENQNFTYENGIITVNKNMNALISFSVEFMYSSNKPYKLIKVIVARNNQEKVILSAIQKSDWDTVNNSKIVALQEDDEIRIEIEVENNISLNVRQGSNFLQIYEVKDE